MVSPVAETAPAARYLRRRGGDGGYMVMIQTDDFDADRRRMQKLGVRVAWDIELDDIRGMHLHPRDTGGTLLSIDQPLPPFAWRWAGPDWQTRVRTERATEILAAELLSPQPAALAERWAAILGRAAIPTASSFEIRLDRGTLRFAPADERGEGLGGFDARTRDAAAVLRAARERDLPIHTNPDRIDVGGVRVTLVPSPAAAT